MPADINKKVYRVRAQGLRRKRLLLELENQSGFELWIFEWENAVVYCYSTLFVSKLGDGNLDIECAIFKMC